MAGERTERLGEPIRLGEKLSVQTEMIVPDEAAPNHSGAILGWFSTEFGTDS